MGDKWGTVLRLVSGHIWDVALRMESQRKRAWKMKEKLGLYRGFW